MLGYMNIKVCTVSGIMANQRQAAKYFAPQFVTRHTDAPQIKQCYISTHTLPSHSYAGYSSNVPPSETLNSGKNPSIS